MGWEWGWGWGGRENKHILLQGSAPPQLLVVLETGDLYPSLCALLVVTPMHLHQLSTTIAKRKMDKGDKPPPWRYIKNDKESITEKCFAIYMEEVTHSALGYPKSRLNHPGERGVILCDGVGTHLGKMSTTL